MFRVARLLTALLAFTLFAANSASAVTTVSAEKPASGSLGVFEHRVGFEALASSDRIDEKLSLLYDFASDFPVAARAVAPSSRALGRALEASGIARPAESAAHHIVAGSAQGAAAARATLQRLGIGINDAANGVFLRGAEHAGIHTAEYYEAVNKALAGATTRAEAERILQQPTTPIAGLSESVLETDPTGREMRPRK